MSKEIIYQELGLESLESRRSFFTLFKNKSPDYLLRIIPQRSSCNTRNSDEIPLFNAKHNFYKNSFLNGN